ncbi:MAG TPA: HAMP domain-containing histidine kinase [Clostridiales bacterium]|nr:HAMP domain-containing histidine kinase [Clostridiales bacterium]
MKHNFFGIFGKVFFYTVLILTIVIVAMFVFLSDQIKSAVETTQQLQIADAFQTFFVQIEGRTDEEAAELARQFHQKNTSFEFCLENSDKEVIFQTDHFKRSDIPSDLDSGNKIITKGTRLTQNRMNFFKAGGSDRFQFVTISAGGMRLYVTSSTSGAFIYHIFIWDAIAAFAIVFCASLIAAAVFARRITKPIKKIAGDTRKMSELQIVDEPRQRNDEIGQLAGDVYKMYRALQSTIEQLEYEIKREKEMEENQRFFFSAASHELKTPIAATSALLEGMLENVVRPEEYPKYIRECMRMTKEQSRLVSEILEMVKLSGGLIVQKQESTNLKETIESVIGAHKSIADARNIDLDMDIPGNIFCTYDTGLFAKALSNVVINAIDNTSDGKKVHLYVKRDGLKIRLYIFNEGETIPEEDLPRLFEPFFSRDKARSKTREHSGLGLAIVKKTLDLMEVPFFIENMENGVLFCMDLPY